MHKTKWYRDVKETVTLRYCSTLVTEAEVYFLKIKVVGSVTHHTLVGDNIHDHLLVIFWLKIFRSLSECYNTHCISV